MLLGPKITVTPSVCLLVYVLESSFSSLRHATFCPSGRDPTSPEFSKELFTTDSTSYSSLVPPHTQTKTQTHTDTNTYTCVYDLKGLLSLSRPVEVPTPSSLPVSDVLLTLHSVTPSREVEFPGGIFLTCYGLVFIQTISWPIILGNLSVSLFNPYLEVPKSREHVNTRTKQIKEIDKTIIFRTRWRIGNQGEIIQLSPTGQGRRMVT